MQKELQNKLQHLENILRNHQPLIIALSGGIDSVTLTFLAHRFLGDRMLAVTSVSPSVPSRDIEDTRQFVQKYGIRHRFIETREFENENYVANPPDRCYYCKHELYSELIQLAKKEGYYYIANGANYDDLGDYRPGMKAADEFQVISPFILARITKEDIRNIAREFQLKWWSKPASPCLASRIPYGEKVTPEKLKMVEKAEHILDELNIPIRRVRHFGEMARIEVPPEYFEVVHQNAEKIKEGFVKLGFKQFELKPFKSGSLNEVLNGSGKA